MIQVLAIISLTSLVIQMHFCTRETDAINESDLIWIAEHKYFSYDAKSESIDGHQKCYIQRFQPFHPSIIKYVRKLPPIRCDQNQVSLTYVNNSGFLKFDEEALNKTQRTKESLRCRYAEVLRDNSVKEDTFRLDKAKIFQKPTDVRHADFISVTCYNLLGVQVYHNIHMHIRDIPEVYKKNDVLKYNFLLFGIDSLSRLNAMRQLPKTYSYLKDELHTFILGGYHKVGSNTFPNLASLLTGYHPLKEPPAYLPREKELKPHDPWPFIWKNFSSQGYRTMFAEDEPMYNAFHYMSGGFDAQPTDHYARTFWKAVDQSKIHSSSPEFCFGSQVMHQLQMDYIYCLVKKLYGKTPFWALSYLTEICHGRLNTVGLADEDIFAFLKKLNEKKFLENTILIFFSDHGQRFDRIRESYIGSIEDKMPMIAIHLPKRFRDSQVKAVQNLKVNEKRLTTAFDVYCTMMDILKLGVDARSKLGHTKTLSGVSLFSEISKNRTCKDAGVDGEFCTCQKEVLISSGEEFVRIGAQHLVDNINSMLFAELQNSRLCAKLVLSKIMEAHMPSEMTVSKEKVVTIKIETAPSGGIFEGIVTVSGQSQQYVNASYNIERINRYGDQSKCISDRLLRVYCYCI